ncbi:hypothetical protein [Streptomyces barringtoniae]|uniref:hypothetical protein n=1 Tax=Streptomyces barringtoniae TaxID=2892029 RepID=UPI001E30C9DE|nr:hypothetical protein [Streptomyces barringtoniae]MCC5479059.1 hypothetical protein [Streptomyces barringtoniae]
MSLAAVAIIVSSASAAFTMINMFVSAATYRRGGPRLKLSFELQPYQPREALLAEDRNRWRSYLHVHVRNRSSASVEVETVQIYPVMVFMALLGSLLWKEDMFANFLNFAYHSRVSFLDGEDKKKIAPFSGSRWVLDESFTTMARPNKWVARALLFRVRVTLTNGQEVQSRPMFYLKARKHQAAMYKEFEATLDNRKRAETPTLDDALKEQESEAK